MKAKGILVRLALWGAGVLTCCSATAQMYRPQAFTEDAPLEPSLVLGLSPSGVDALNRDFAREARALDLVRGKVGADRLAEMAAERPEPWILYARVYVLNFQNNLGEQKFTESQIGFGRTGPAIAGKIYIGIRKRF